MLTFFFVKLVHGRKVNIDIELRFRIYEFYFGALVANDHYFRPKLYYIQVQINGKKKSKILLISVTARYFILLRQKPNTQKSLHLAKEKIIIIEQRRRSRNLINGRLRFDDDLITITLNSDRAL